MKFNVRFTNLNPPRGKLLGYTTLDGRHILIQKGLGKKQLFEVMMHELAHSVLAQMGIRKSKKEHERIARKVGKHATKLVFKN